MAKKEIKKYDYTFYEAILGYYKDNRVIIRRNYKDITKKILDFNDKDKNLNAFLRKPQFEAFEIYVFIKEFLNNQKVKEMFADWFNKKNGFSYREEFDRGNQLSFFEDEINANFNNVYDMLAKQDQIYPNYIYALTMGTGKTILMATCIFYEFLLANKYPKDTRYCHNALVFAPDKTVLQSLREIQTFDMKKVIPSEYASILSSNIKFHYLDDSSTTLNTIDNSDFNIIVSNTQKIILKEVHKEKSAAERFMSNYEQLKADFGEMDDFLSDLYGGLDVLQDEKNVTINQRFEKLIRLNQLGVYVDEAHHLFGTELKKELSDNSKETSLRYTINKIAEALERKSTKLVGCYNYTGTPYVDNQILPEVVYTYGLKEAISNNYLKQVEVQGYENVKNEEFLRNVLTDFFNYYGNETYEGLKPKIAIFGSEVKEVTDVIKPMVENILSDLGIDLSTMLVNVGDTTITKELDIKYFNNLDVVGTEGSQKQVILLVNKGREGWNCRSLFSVALFRAPKSTVFVLQATMRCLRAITETQQLAHVYLSKENYDILDNELQKNFNVNIKKITEKPVLDKRDYYIKIVEPVKNLTLEEIKKTYELIEKDYKDKKFIFNVDDIDTEKYTSKLIKKRGLDSERKGELFEIESGNNREYSKYTLVFEVAKYLNVNPLIIKGILETNEEFDKIVEFIANYNDALYDYLIPTLFHHMFELKEKTETKTKNVPLIKYRNGMDHFVFSSTEGLTIQKDEALISKYSKKSFHTDRYCFDSEPERKLFLQFLESSDVKEVYFTGMFTGQENGLSVQYIDPESNLIRNYYPDILVYYNDGSIEIIEVKGDNKIDDEVVAAKAYAAMELAEQSKMKYDMVASSTIMSGKYKIVQKGGNNSQ